MPTLLLVYCVFPSNANTEVIKNFCAPPFKVTIMYSGNVSSVPENKGGKNYFPQELS